jgi:hypothetical protein
MQREEGWQGRRKVLVGNRWWRWGGGGIVDDSTDRPETAPAAASRGACGDLGLLRLNFFPALASLICESTSGGHKWKRANIGSC